MKILVLLTIQTIVQTTAPKLSYRQRYSQLFIFSCSLFKQTEEWEKKEKSAPLLPTVEAWFNKLITIFKAETYEEYRIFGYSKLAPCIVYADKKFIENNWRWLYSH